MARSSETGVVGVTGATGHLGQWVISELTKRGYETVSISRTPTKIRTIESLGFPSATRTLALDLSDWNKVQQASPQLLELDYVLHLAGYIPDDTNKNVEFDAAKTLKQNVTSMVHLLRSVRSSKRLKAVLFASSFEVYGTPRQLPVDEDHPTEPLSYYGASKLACEKYLSIFGNETGLRHCSFRLPAVYGPGDQLNRAIGNFIRATTRKEPLAIYGDGSDRRDLVYAGDAARALADCLETPVPTVLNLGSGTGYSILEMAQAVQSLLDGTEIVMAERKKPKLDYVLSIERAKQELNWSPEVSLEQGIKAQLQWHSRRETET